MGKYYICITPFFPSSSNWRGAYILDQVKAIERNSNYKVLVFKPCGLFKMGQQYDIEGITVYPIPSWFMPSYFFNGLGGTINSRNFFKKLCGMGIAMENVAVIHVHTAGFSCYLIGIKQINPQIKTVVQYHDLDPFQIRLGKFAGWKTNITYRVTKFAKQFENIDLHLCISERTQYNLIHFPKAHPNEKYLPYLKALDVAQGLSIPMEIKSYVLYNGVDLSLFHSLDEKQEHSIFRIGCVANFQELKDHITLIKAIELISKKYPMLELLVSFIGSGPTKASCIKYIQSHRLSKYFKFENEVTHNQLPKYFNTIDLFVLPSYFEGFGCVYTEAAACNVPFVGCLNQGYSEYLKDKDKSLWLIEPHDYIRLSEIITRQIFHPIKQSLCHTYDINTLVKNYLAYLKTI